MEGIYRHYIIDMSCNNNFVQIPTVQGDGNNVRGFEVELISNNVQYVIDPENTIVSIAGTKPDTSTILNNCEVTEEGYILVDITTQMSAVAGRGDYQIVLMDKNTNSQLKSFPFYILTTPASFNAEAATSSDEFGLLVKTTVEAASVVDRAEEVVTRTEVLSDSIHEAEATRVENENIRTTNEEARIAAETERISAEEIRKTNEEQRVEDEDIRLEAEIIRNASETTRIENEHVRQSNEETRVKNEEQRVADETIRLTSEETRVESENVRITAETERIASENIRKESESIRVSNEDKRIADENVRIESENTRLKNEEERVSSEDTRKANETTRIASEEKRIEDENIRLVNEEVRVEAENIRTTNEEARITAEEERAMCESFRLASELERVQHEQERRAAYEIAEGATLRAVESATQAEVSATRAEVAAKRAEEVSLVGFATETTAGIMAGGDNTVDENGTLILTRITTDATLSDSKVGGLKIEHIYGKSEQPTHGYTGVNKFDKTLCVEGLEIDYDNLQFIASESATALNYMKCKNNQTYTLSGIPSDVGFEIIYSNVLPSDAVACTTITPLATEYDGGVYYVFKTSEDTEYITFVITTEHTITDYLDVIQVEIGNVPTTYEPYVGGTYATSPNPYVPVDIQNVEISSIKCVKNPDDSQFVSEITLTNPVVLRGIGDVKDEICKQNGEYGVLRRIGTYQLPSDGEYKMGITIGVAQYTILETDIIPATDETIVHPIISPYFVSGDPVEVSGSAMALVSSSDGVQIRLRNTKTFTEGLVEWLTETDVTFNYILPEEVFEPLSVENQIALHQLETFDNETYLIFDSSIVPEFQIEYGTSPVGAYTLKNHNDIEIERLIFEIENDKLNEELNNNLKATNDALREDVVHVTSGLRTEIESLSTELTGLENRFVAIIPTENNPVWTSNPESSEYDKIFGNGVFVDCAGNYSHDGRIWHKSNIKDCIGSNLIPYYNSVKYGNGIFVALVFAPEEDAYMVLYTTDGMSWNVASTIGLNELSYDYEYEYKISYTKGVFMIIKHQRVSMSYQMVRESGRTISCWTSTDGDTWTQGADVIISNGFTLSSSTNMFLSYFNITHLTGGNGIFCFSGRYTISDGSSTFDSQFTYYTTNNGTSWTKISQTYMLNCCTYGLSKFVAFDMDTNMYVSTDAKTWTKTTYSIDGTSTTFATQGIHSTYIDDDALHIQWLNDRFYIIANQNGSPLYESINTTTWTYVYVPRTFSSNLSYGNGILLWGDYCKSKDDVEKSLYLDNFLGTFGVNSSEDRNPSTFMPFSFPIISKGSITITTTSEPALFIPFEPDSIYLMLDKEITISDGTVYGHRITVIYTSKNPKTGIGTFSKAQFGGSTNSGVTLTEYKREDAFGISIKPSAVTYRVDYILMKIM